MQGPKSPQSETHQQGFGEDVHPRTKHALLFVEAVTPVVRGKHALWGPLDPPQLERARPSRAE